MDTLHFYITGEAIMNIARERYKVSADVQKGVKILTKALIGFKEEDAIEVVLGRKKLCGDCNEGVYMEDDNTKVRPNCFLTPSQPNSVICGWINPEGEIYGDSEYNGSNNHYVLADYIVSSGMVKETSSLNLSENVLTEHGWIKFSPYEAVAFVAPACITNQQKEALTTWMDCNAIGGFEFHGKFYTRQQIINMELLQFAINISIRN